MGEPSPNSTMSPSSKDSINSFTSNSSHSNDQMPSDFGTPSPTTSSLQNSPDPRILQPSPNVEHVEDLDPIQPDPNIVPLNPGSDVQESESEAIEIDKSKPSHVNEDVVPSCSNTLRQHHQQETVADETAVENNALSNTDANHQCCSKSLQAGEVTLKLEPRASAENVNQIQEDGPRDDEARASATTGQVPEISSQIHISNMSIEVSIKELGNLLLEFGNFEILSLVPNSSTCSAMVRFSSTESADKAADKLNGHILYELEIVATVVAPRKRRRSSSSDRANPNVHRRRHTSSESDVIVGARKPNKKGQNVHFGEFKKAP